MEQRLWTIEEVKEFFKVKDSRTIHKFIRQGLKVFKIGCKDFRFDPKDVYEFVEIQKEIAQQELHIVPIKKKAKHKTMNIDFQKRKINLELNRVV